MSKFENINPNFGEEYIKIKHETQKKIKHYLGPFIMPNFIVIMDALALLAKEYT